MDSDHHFKIAVVALGVFLAVLALWFFLRF
jgi:hypothetical protein